MNFITFCLLLYFTLYIRVNTKEICFVIQAHELHLFKYSKIAKHYIVIYNLIYKNVYLFICGFLHINQIAYQRILLNLF